MVGPNRGHDTWRSYPRPLDAGGVRGLCSAAGAGPPVVLLPSALVRARPYRPTAAALARDHRVYLVEPPGSGRAARLPAPWSLEDYAGWAAAAVAALGLDDATVVGHSHAGGVAVILAALHPGRIGRVVVVGGIGNYRQPLWRAAAGRLADSVEVETRAALREWSSLAWTAADHPRNFARQVRLSLAADLTGYAARAAVPVLYAWGARDQTIPPASADQYARVTPGAEVYVSRAGSHGWLITHSAEFAAVVADFVRRTGRREVPPGGPPGTPVAPPHGGGQHGVDADPSRDQPG